MEGITLEFLSEYYLWFIIGGIILVMAVIGYIADKTDFGRKNKISEENSKLKDEQENNNSITEAPNAVVEEVSPQEQTVSDVVEPIESINSISNEIDVPMIEDSVIDEIKVEEQPIDEKIESVQLGEDLENIKVEENDIEQPAINDINDISINNEEKVEIPEVIDDSVYVLNNDLSSFAAGDLNENVPVSSVVEDVINDQDNDDDIWKF